MVMLYEKIRNFIQEKGGYIDIQLGSNIIQIRLEYYFWLLYEGIEDEDTKSKIRKNIAVQLKKSNEIENLDSISESEESLREQLFGGSDTILEVVDQLQLIIALMVII